MNGFTSLKQVEKVTVELAGKLRPVPVFAGAVPLQGGGVTSDFEAGRLVLSPGSYLIAFNIVAHWRYASLLRASVVLGGDERYRGPRAVAEHESGALAIIDLLDAAELKKLDWDKTSTRHLTGWSIVPVPPGEPVTAELWAGADDADRSAKVTFTSGELFAVQLGGVQ